MDSRLLKGEGRQEALDIARSRPVVPPIAADAYELEQQKSLSDVWHIILKRRWYIISTVILITTLTTFTSLRATKIYQSVGRIAIFHENSDPLGFNKTPDYSDDFDYGVTLDTEVKILTSDKLAVETAKKIMPDTAPSRPATNSLTEAPQVSPQQRALANRIRGGLSAVVLPRTRIVELRFEDRDPKFAMKAVNAIIDTYIEQNIKTKFEATEHTSSFLSKQLTDMQLKMETAQEKLVRYEKENGIIGIDDKTNIITAKLAQLNAELTAAESERIKKESEYRMAAGNGGSSEVTPGSNGVDMLTQLREKEGDLRVRYAELNTQFGPSYPKVAEVRSQLTQIQAQIEEERKHQTSRSFSDYQVALHREQMLRAALNQQKREANDLNEKAIQFGVLKHEAESNRQIYESMLQKLKEAGVSAGLRSSNVRVVDSAQLPSTPIKPNVPRNIWLAFFLSIGTGVVLAFVREGLDNTINTAEQAHAVAGLPSMGIVPFGQMEGEKKRALPLLAAAAVANGRSGLELVSHVRPQSQIAEAYRSIRTSLLLSAATPPRVILITSALPQEGKTMTSVNSAIVMAQKGQRVLLIDCDLRRPSVAKSLGVNARAGVSTVLTGRDSLESAIVAHPQVANVFVLPSGPIPPHPAELLASEQMRTLVDQCRERFDHVIIDSPPVLSVTDAVILSSMADSVMLVLRAGKTTKQALRRARELLTYVGAPTAGMILNAVNVGSPEHYYYYYGRYRSYYASGDAE